MKLCQNSFNEFEKYITPSEIIEFMYCNRFTYFMNCLEISQNEDKRYKVQKGKEKHIDKSNTNIEYVRKKINGKAKFINAYLISEKYKLKGIVDEIYELQDGTFAPLDYKYAVYDEKDYLTYKYQMVMYSLMIEEIYKCKVEKFYLVYCRSNNKLVEEVIDPKLRREVEKALDMYGEVMKGYYPKATKSKARCNDCCYNKICIA